MNMWIIINYDLPVKTKIQRKDADKFRKSLLKSGFVRLQYSCYIRHCLTKQSTEGYIKKIKQLLTDNGNVAILKITNKQCEGILTLSDKKIISKIQQPKQLELF